MAKATAICTCEKCGAEFKKIAYKNNRKDADSWEEWAKKTFTVCPECEDQMCRERAEKYHEEAREAGLPDLVGTQKQIMWAEEIRHDMIQKLNEELEKERGMLDIGPSEDVVKNAHERYETHELIADYAMHQEMATWFIDRRGADAFSFLRSATLEKEALAWKTEQRYEETELEKEPEADDAIVVPENATEGTVEIVVTDDRVTAYYPKDDKFREIAKDAGFRWDPSIKRWQRIITARSGSAIDRAADLANRLLRAGFSVRCINAAVREKAIDGVFEPEYKRWITACLSGEYKGWLCIEIPKRYADPDSQKLYNAARKINGSKWNRDMSCVVVPAAQYMQARDFAEIYGYKMTNGANQTISDYQLQASSRKSVAKPKNEEHKDVLKEILESDDAVLADLEDD